LQADLHRAGMPTYAWVVNQSFAAGDSQDPVLRRKAALEAAFIAEVEAKSTTRTAVLPWAPVEPVGLERLRQFVNAGNRKELVSQ
jgi:arsenite-transporting ATPase